MDFITIFSETLVDLADLDVKKEVELVKAKFEGMDISEYLENVVAILRKNLIPFFEKKGMPFKFRFRYQGLTSRYRTLWIEPQIWLSPQHYQLVDEAWTRKSPPYLKKLGREIEEFISFVDWELHVIRNVGQRDDESCEKEESDDSDGIQDENLLDSAFVVRGKQIVCESLWFEVLSVDEPTNN